jgi:hypothetical protein
MEVTTTAYQHEDAHTEQLAADISWADYLQLECQIHSSFNVTRAESKLLWFAYF